MNEWRAPCQNEHGNNEVTSRRNFTELISQKIKGVSNVTYRIDQLFMPATSLLYS